MAEKKKKPVKKEPAKPVKMKDGSIKMGTKTFKSEKEFMAYMDKMAIVDGAKSKKK